MDKRIEEVCDERNSGGDYFVYLKRGYSFSNPPQHCFGAVNKKEISNTMRRVAKCNCDDCQAGYEWIIKFAAACGENNS